MVNFILKKIVGTQNERVVRQLKPMVDVINSFESSVSKMTDTELKAKTDEFKARVRKSYDERKADLDAIEETFKRKRREREKGAT
jgi:preprotein translocase subunit SecA